MSAVRMRIPGNLPETKIVCDRLPGVHCSQNVWGIDAKEARRRAIHGFAWSRVDGKDFCPDHAPLAAEGES